jgi:cytochrome c biogenesis protein CcdA
MIYAGILVTLLGFTIAVLSLGMTSSVNARLVMVLVGIAVSLFGIMGLINKAYLKNAIWRKQS